MKARRLLEAWPSDWFEQANKSARTPEPSGELEQTPFDEAMFARFARQDPLLSRFATKYPLEAIFNSEVLEDFENMRRWTEFVKNASYMRGQVKPQQTEADESDALLSEPDPLPPDHEAHEIPGEDVAAADAKLDDMSDMVAAYDFLLGPDHDMRHVNRIETIWATTPEGQDAQRIAQYLDRNGIAPEGGSVVAAQKFSRLRAGADDNGGADPDYFNLPPQEGHQDQG